MPAILSLVIELLAGGLDAAVVLTGSPGGAAMLAAAAAAGLFLALTVVLRPDLVRSATALDPVAVRRRAERTVFLPLCDPGASGRPRPRAPSALCRAA